MHILLTDQLVCPRCGPDFGLILLSDRAEDRDVAEGALGCSNCRTMYPIEAGVAYLKTQGGAEVGIAAPASPDDERALRIAALLGVTQPNAMVLIVAAGWTVAADVAATVPDIHVVGAAGAGAEDAGSPGGGVLSRIVTGRSLPLRTGSLRGLAIVGVEAGDLVEEAIRVLAPGARIVVDGAPAGLSSLLSGGGFEVHLEQDGVVVASPRSRS